MGEAMTRRDWLAGPAAALIVSGCARPVHLAQSETTIARAPAYDQRVYDIVRRLVASQGAASRKAPSIRTHSWFTQPARPFVPWALPR